MPLGKYGAIMHTDAPFSEGMGNGDAGMRKSNWIILAVLAAASAFFLWLWYYLNFNLVDNPVDLAFTVVWWAVIVAACVGIHLAEKKRRERIRTAFLASGMIYNGEAGVIRLEPGASMTDALQEMLSHLEYGFDMAAVPDKSRVRFVQIVRTSKFSGNGDTWEGEVVRVARPDDPRPFSNRDQLRALIDR